MSVQHPSQSVVLYTDPDGHSALDVRLDGETVWLSQKQMSALFKKDVRTVSEHIRNIFKEGELKPKSVLRNFRMTGADGKSYDVQCYNLDVIISVGYRVKSREGTQFRQWATDVLRRHVIKGFTVQHARIAERGIEEFEKAAAMVRAAVTQRQLSGAEAEGFLSIITEYARSWLLLQQYSTKTFPPRKVRTSRRVKDVGTTDATAAIGALAKDLKKRGTLPEGFGIERTEGVLHDLLAEKGSGAPLVSVERRAAELLYRIIRERPFQDGNKRIGSLLFVLYLQRHGRLKNPSGERTISDAALVAIALLVAESKSTDRSAILRLIEAMV